MSRAISLHNLTRRFADRVAVDDISFDVDAGQLVALLGPNGSGKTTLFGLLSTMLAPSSGHASIFGFDLQTQASDVRNQLGVVFQNPAVDPQLTARENLTLHGRLFGIRDRERVDAALANADLIDRANERVKTFSGGMRRRLEIAKALLPKPRLLLLDEADTGLDVPSRHRLLVQLQSLARESGTTILLTTHLLDQASGCDRVALMHRGKLIAFDAPDTLCRNTGGAMIQIENGDLAAAAELMRTRFQLATATAAHGISAAYDSPAELASPLLAALAPLGCSVRFGPMTLDDVFLRLTGESIHTVATT